MTPLDLSVPVFYLFCDKTLLARIWCRRAESMGDIKSWFRQMWEPRFFRCLCVFWSSPQLQASIVI